MPGENIQDWSTSATLNGNADSAINWAEGQPRASVNNSSRSMMAAHAKDRNLKNGSIVTAGSANAQTFFSGLDYTTVPTGLLVKLKIGPGLTNTGAATLNMDNIGAVAIKDQLGHDVTSGALFTGTYADFIYNGTNWIALAAAAGALANVRVFAVTTPYPTTTATCNVLVYIKGSGGGGGASLSAGPNGGGGGEGEEVWFFTTALTLSTRSMIVGAGGSQGFDGVQGSVTGVDGLCSAEGGFGGVRGNFGGTGGRGGTGGIGGSYRMPGAAGQCGADSTGTIGLNASGGGKGGGGMFQNGVANSGGGGGCGTNVNSPGNGGSGIVVCYEYGII